MLSDVCLTCLLRTSLAYVENREAYIGRPILAQRYPTSHVTRTSLSRSKGQVTRPLYSPRLHIRQLQRWAWESIHRGEPILLHCRLQARRREALRRPQRKERGGGISWRPPAYSLTLAEWRHEHQMLTHVCKDLGHVPIVEWPMLDVTIVSDRRLCVSALIFVCQF